MKKKFWNILEKVAIASDPVGRMRLAACLVYKNELISIGTNKYKTHPIAKQFSKNDHAIYLHAEIDAIKNALRVVDVDFLTKCTMYVMRVKHPDHDHKGFVRGMAKPCCGCEMGLESFGIKRVYFTTDDGYGEL